MSATPVLRKALDTLRGPAGGAQPKDIFQAQYWEMAGAHALLLNGLLSVYEVCDALLQRDTSTHQVFLASNNGSEE